MQFALWKYPVHWLAYGFGLGRIMIAPGTFGSLLGIPLFWLMSGLAPAMYAAIVVAFFIPGIFICGQTARDVGAIDPGFIVYDEIGWIEDKLGLGSGIMADDVIAGLYTLAVLQAARLLIERFVS